MQLSIKVVVCALVAFVSLCATMVAIVPSIYHLHDNAIGFVAGAASRGADQAQFVLERKLRVVSNFANAVDRAFTNQNLISGLQPWPLVSWVGATVLEEQIAVHIWRSDNRGFIVTHYDTIFGLAPPMPGYVFIYNTSTLTENITCGFFNIANFQPANLTVPWRIMNTDQSRRSSEVNRLLICGPTDPTAQRRASAAAKQSHTCTTRIRRSDESCRQRRSCRASIFYGGLSRQFLVLIHQQHFLNNQLWNHPVRCAHPRLPSIPDPQSLGSTTLVQLSDVQDRRIGPIVSSTLAESLVHEYLPTSNDADGSLRGADAIIHCIVPCTFIYWPHRDILEAYSPSEGSINPSILWRPFTIVKVLRVESDPYATNVSGRALSGLNLRLVVTVPSNDVVEDLLSAYRWNLLWIVALVAVLTIVSLWLVWCVLQFLTVSEVRLQHMVVACLLGHAQCVTDDHHGVCTARFSSFAARHISEAFRLFVSIHQLARSFRMLHAFVPGTNRQHTSCASEPANHDASVKRFEYVSPYSTQSLGMWGVPVTSLHIIMSSGPVNHSDPIKVFHQHRALLEVVQRALYGIPGAVLDFFYGLRFFIHFNPLHERLSTC